MLSLFQNKAVIATDFMRKGTLLCLYAGEMAFLRDYAQSQENDIFTLWRTGYSTTTLIVRASRYANIARYFNVCLLHYPVVDITDWLNSISSFTNQTISKKQYLICYIQKSYNIVLVVLRFTQN